MNRARALIFGSVVAAALMAGAVAGATASGFSLIAASAAIGTATSPTPAPSFKSNETATHESGESAAQETAENNGTFHPGGPRAGGGACGGHSNEDATHEKTESAARETAENAPCPTGTTNPSPTK